MIYAEVENGEIHPVCYELLGRGKEIAEELDIELCCLLLGSETAREEVDELIYRGANRVFWYNHPVLQEFDPILYKQIFVNLVQETQAQILLLGATPQGRSLAPRIAAALNTGLTADCIELELDCDSLIQIRPAFTGSVIARIKTSTKPQMSTVRYKVMTEAFRDTSRKGKIELRTLDVIPETGLKVLEKEAVSGVDLTKAEIIISGGRGIKKKEDLEMLMELAELFGGAYGCSRPIVDGGWLGKEHQVGFSGNTVRPRIYIACGISGSPQHLAGMRNSDVIVAINNDPSAPIFKIADYGIIGDVYDVIPKLIQEIKSLRSDETEPA